LVNNGFTVNKKEEVSDCRRAGPCASRALQASSFKRLTEDTAYVVVGQTEIAGAMSDPELANMQCLAFLSPSEKS